VGHAQYDNHWTPLVATRTIGPDKAIIVHGLASHCRNDTCAFTWKNIECTIQMKICVRLIVLALLAALTSVEAAAQVGRAEGCQESASCQSAAGSQRPAPDTSLDERLLVAWELLQVTQAEKQFESTILNTLKTFGASLKKAQPAKSAEIDATLRVVSEKMVLRKSQFMEVLAPLYVEAFSVQELREIVAFYKSATGQKIVREQPLLLRKSG
jgi:hypothetical protein